MALGKEKIEVSAERIEDESRGRLHRALSLACTHLQEITIPVWKGHLPGLDAWAGQVSEEWDSPVTDARWIENL